MDASTDTEGLPWNTCTFTQAFNADCRYQEASSELGAAVRLLKTQERAREVDEKVTYFAGTWLGRRMLKRWKASSARQKQIKNAFTLCLIDAHQ